MSEPAANRPCFVRVVYVDEPIPGIGQTNTLLRDVEVRVMERPDDVHYEVAPRVSHINAELTTYAEGTFTVWVEDYRNGNVRPVVCSMYDIRETEGRDLAHGVLYEGYAHYIDDERTPDGGYRVWHRLMGGLERAVPVKDAPPDPFKSEADLVQVATVHYPSGNSRPVHQGENVSFAIGMGGLRMREQRNGHDGRHLRVVR